MVTAEGAAAAVTETEATGTGTGTGTDSTETTTVVTMAAAHLLLPGIGTVVQELPDLPQLSSQQRLPRAVQQQFRSAQYSS